MSFPNRYQPVKKRAFDNNVPRDESGSPAVEFALTAPVFITMLFGIMHLGWALHCGSSVQFALERAARTKIVNSAVTVSDLRASMAAFLDNVASDAFTLALEDTTISGVKVSRITATYPHQVDIPLIPSFTLTFTPVSVVPR